MLNIVEYKRKIVFVQGIRNDVIDSINVFLHESQILKRNIIDEMEHITNTIQEEHIAINNRLNEIERNQQIILQRLEDFYQFVGQHFVFEINGRNYNRQLQRENNQLFINGFGRGKHILTLDELMRNIRNH